MFQDGSGGLPIPCTPREARPPEGGAGLLAVTVAGARQNRGRSSPGANSGLPVRHGLRGPRNGSRRPTGGRSKPATGYRGRRRGHSYTTLTLGHYLRQQPSTVARHRSPTG
ncbi:hypothetical protein EVA_08799 [gut metagenome]|uniref:Uncharacterized protein n=1 Tax=gut metagenome TaxID=749906 RepID=J9CSD4_9ZZZZ